MKNRDMPEIPFYPELDSGCEYREMPAYFMVFYLTHGTTTLAMGNEKERLTAGDGYIIAPNMPFAFEQEYMACSRRDVNISVDLMHDCCGFVDRDLFDELVSKRYVPFKLSYNKILVLEEKFFAFLRGSNVKQRKRDEKTLTVNLLSELCSSARTDRQKTGGFYSQCVTILNRVCTFPDYLQILQKEVGYHKVYLCKKFKQVFGISVKEYVKDLRMQFAEYHLKNTDLPAAQICTMAGIESFSYFNKIFKETFGTTPTKYRRKFRE